MPHGELNIKEQSEKSQFSWCQSCCVNLFCTFDTEQSFSTQTFECIAAESGFHFSRAAYAYSQTALYSTSSSFLHFKCTVFTWSFSLTLNPFNNARTLAQPTSMSLKLYKTKKEILWNATERKARFIVTISERTIALSDEVLLLKMQLK